ncbi:MAG TPA: RDD family protein [Lysobacter sp.]
MASHPDEPRTALIGWRLLALFYDLWPMVALWMLASLVFTVGFTLGGHANRENIAPFSALQWLLWLVCWLITGAYALLSWHRGGQTLGMRPWRLRLVGIGEQSPGWRALAIRYVVGSVSLLLAGLGFWWAWFDRDRLTWHDRASGTRMVRLAKVKK